MPRYRLQLELAYEVDLPNEAVAQTLLRSARPVDQTILLWSYGTHLPISSFGEVWEVPSQIPQVPQISKDFAE